MGQLHDVEARTASTSAYRCCSPRPSLHTPARPTPQNRVETRGMGKAQRRARIAKGRSPKDRVEMVQSNEHGALAPTPEQALRLVYAVDEFSENVGGRLDLRKKRMRRVPVIDTMLAKGELTDEHHRRLTHYRDQAAIAERSPTRSCLADRSGGGAGDASPSAAVVSAMIATGRIERDLGSFLGIARAVAVDDKSLTEWCIERYGGRERYDGSGAFIAVVPHKEADVVPAARADLRSAAARIVV